MNIFDNGVVLNQKFQLNDTINTQFELKREIIPALVRITGKQIKFPTYWNWKIKSIVKNIQDFLATTYNIYLSKEGLSELKNIVSNIECGQAQLICEFTDNFDWYSKFIPPNKTETLIDYLKKKYKLNSKEHNNCILDKNTQSEMLEAGVYPIVFYNMDMECLAYAMALSNFYILPYDISNNCILFNACGISVREITLILAEYYNCKYKLTSSAFIYNDESSLYDMVETNSGDVGILFEKYST